LQNLLATLGYSGTSREPPSLTEQIASAIAGKGYMIGEDKDRIRVYQMPRCIRLWNTGLIFLLSSKLSRQILEIEVRSNQVRATCFGSDLFDIAMELQSMISSASGKYCELVVRDELRYQPPPEW